MRCQGYVVGIACLGLLIIILSLACRGVNATDPPEKICLIIVSGAWGYSEHEIGKASSFYDHCISTDIYNEEDIVYLADTAVSNTDGPANISNIEDAFEWLDDNSDPNMEIVIYISDHEQVINNEIYFAFEDGNISSSTIDSWIDEITCEKITVILNGERSALAGPDLSGSSRDIICSMESDQLSIDNFNITRSLEDPEADLNIDGKVDYIEAFLKEVEWLQGSGQDPVLYSPQ